MLKFTAKGNDQEIIGIGLSHKNLEYLKKGQPIDVDCEELGVKGIRVFIFAGETEEKMRDDLRKMGIKFGREIGPDDPSSMGDT